MSEHAHSLELLFQRIYTAMGLFALLFLCPKTLKQKALRLLHTVELFLSEP